MTKDEKLLVKVYEKTKVDLRLLAKNEKAFNGYRNTIIDPQTLPFLDKVKINQINQANSEHKKVLVGLGYTKFNNEKDLIDDFKAIGLKIITKIEQTIISIIPQTYKGEYCTVYEHYELQMAQIYAGSGFCHASFITDKGDKYCVSPYGYVFLGLEKFGRILKDGTIKKGKPGRFGGLKYN